MSLENEVSPPIYTEGVIREPVSVEKTTNRHEMILKSLYQIKAGLPHQFKLINMGVNLQQVWY